MNQNSSNNVPDRRQAVFVLSGVAVVVLLLIGVAYPMVLSIIAARAVQGLGSAIALAVLLMLGWSVWCLVSPSSSPALARYSKGVGLFIGAWVALAIVFGPRWFVPDSPSLRETSDRGRDGARQPASAEFTRAPVGAWLREGPGLPGGLRGCSISATASDNGAVEFVVTVIKGFSAPGSVTIALRVVGGDAGIVRDLRTGVTIRFSNNSTFSFPQVTSSQEIRLNTRITHLFLSFGPTNEFRGFLDNFSASQSMAIEGGGRAMSFSLSGSSAARRWLNDCERSL